MISHATIQEAANRLVRAAPRGSQVILFGSFARGDAHEGSDLDFLVVEPQVVNRTRESMRLRDVLRPLRVAADVVVGSAEAFNAWKDTPNNVFFAAHHEGKVLHEMG